MADYSPILRDDSVKARFWARVDVRGPDECWEWQAGRTKGYGRFKSRSGPQYMAHRMSLVLAGEIPKDGDVTDHICRNKACVNPKHLRFVSQQINATENSIGIAAMNALKTHCKWGHELDGENLKFNALGGRVCRACERRRMREYMRGVRSKARAEQELALA